MSKTYPCVYPMCSAPHGRQCDGCDGTRTVKPADNPCSRDETKQCWGNCAASGCKRFGFSASDQQSAPSLQEYTNMGSALSATKTRNPKDIAATHKVSFWTIPPGFLVGVSQVLRSGTIKYGEFNWRKEKVKATVYTDAIMRHLLRYLSGEDRDRESGESHLAHIASNCAILMDASELGVLVDDRPTSYSPDRLDELLAAAKERNERNVP